MARGSGQAKEQNVINRQNQQSLAPYRKEVGRLLDEEPFADVDVAMVCLTGSRAYGLANDNRIQIIVGYIWLLYEMSYR